jgi:hypothetical protein
MLFNHGWLTMHFAEFWIIGDSAARRNRSQPGRQAANAPRRLRDHQG